MAEADVRLLAGWGVDLPRRLARSRATGARGELTWIDLERDDPVAVLALGVGSATPADLRAQRSRDLATAAWARAGPGAGLPDFDADQVRAFTEGLLLACSPDHLEHRASTGAADAGPPCRRGPRSRRVRRSPAA